MKYANFEYEKKHDANGYDAIIGLDEAGRGPLAGPVIATAALVKDLHSAATAQAIDALAEVSPAKKAKDHPWTLIRDSKKLSPQQRKAAEAFINEHFIFGIGMVSHETVDRRNVLNATFLAMKAALTQLVRELRATGFYKELMRRSNARPDRDKDLHPKEVKTILLIDGNKEITSINHDQEAIPKGDVHSASIAAASIVSKVTRDELMDAYDTKYPVYGFAQHKGYGTKQHMEALHKYGACPIHRMSFAPVQKAMAGIDD